jgi:drug/metabolite transporter (DMT)-like permease
MVIAQKKSIAVFLIIILAIIWGSSFILMKKGLQVYTPYQVGAIRMFISMISLMPFLVGHFRKVEKSRWKYLLIAGLCGNGIPAILFPLAETRISSALAGMINSMVPIFTLVLGVVFFKMKTDKGKALGIFIGLIGAILFVSGGNNVSGDSNYAYLVVIATICYAVSVNTIRHYLLGLDAIRNTGFALLFSGVPLAIYLFSTDFVDRTMHTPGAAFSLSCVIILGLFGTTISTILFNHLIRISDALTASSCTYLIPVVAVLWGIFDGEKPALIHYIGFVLIISGVYLVTWPKKIVSG